MTTRRMSSFVLGEDTEAEDHLAALMNTADNSAELHPTTAETNDAEKEAEAALDSILETSVAEVNLALSHDDAVAAAVNAAALDATTNASSVVVVDEVAVTAAAAVAASDAAEVMKDTLDAVPSETPLVGVNTAVATTPTNGDNSGTGTTMKAVSQPPVRAGRWSLDEKILFLFGLQKFGKGHWKKISMYVPDRSLVQIKSHAQKVLKRINSGENVFRRLEENVSRLHVLVTQIHSQLNLDPPTVLLQPTTFLSYSGLGELGTGNTGSVVVASDRKNKAVETKDDDGADATQRKRPRNNGNKPSKNGTEHIAASALCQLAGPEDEENEDGTEKMNESSPSVAPGDGGIKADDDLDIGELISI